MTPKPMLNALHSMMMLHSMMLEVCSATASTSQAIMQKEDSLNKAICVWSCAPWVVCCQSVMQTLTLYAKIHFIARVLFCFSCQNTALTFNTAMSFSSSVVIMSHCVLLQDWCIS